jgi:hypothetical protein
MGLYVWFSLLQNNEMNLKMNYFTHKTSSKQNTCNHCCENLQTHGEVFGAE